MSTFTRRSFVKKSGVATIGGVFGLGLLPSLTRKLHATDQSLTIAGTRPAAQSTGISLTLQLASKTQSWEYLGGTLVMSLQLTPTPAAGVCAGSVVMSVLRTAVYTFVKSNGIGGMKNVTYKGTAKYNTLVTWLAENGVARFISAVPIAPTTAPDVAIANVEASNETIGTLFTVGTHASDTNVALSATVLVGDEYSPEYKIGPLPYQTPACVM